MSCPRFLILYHIDVPSFARYGTVWRTEQYALVYRSIYVFSYTYVYKNMFIYVCLLINICIFIYICLWVIITIKIVYKNIPFHLKRWEGGDGGAGEDVTRRLHPQLELIPREALRTALAIDESDRNLAPGELISHSPAAAALSDCEEEDQDDDESEQRKHSPTWVRIPSITVDRDLLDHNGHDPSAPYRVSPDGARTRPLPCSARQSEDPSPTAFLSTKRFFLSRHVQLSSPSCLLCPTSAAASSSSPSCSSFYPPTDTAR